MLILRNFIVILLLLALAVISAVGIMVEAPQIFNWTPDRIHALGHSVLTVMRPGLLLFMVWWVILLGVALVFIITAIRPRKRMKIEVQMGGGKVVIMDAAIKKYIKNALAEIGEVHVKKISLRDHKGLVKTDIFADVRTRENLPVLERRIISRVRAALAEDLGITNLGDVHVLIRNFEVIGRPVKPIPSDETQSDQEKASPSYQEEEAAVKADTPTLSEPVQSANADVPVIEEDELEEAEKPKTVSESITLDDSPAVTESSDSENVIVAEKPLPPQDDIANDAHHDDLDEPLPWSKTADASKPEIESEEERDEKGLPF